jgi:Ca2+-transporting ATPase
MWKMIIGQAIFQLTVTLILHFARGDGFLNYPDEERRSIVFNTFVWMQIFNEFNSRRLDNKFNIFTGLHRNWFFIVINCIMVGCQVVIAFFGGKAFSIVPINGVQWAICIVVAALCLPWAICVRCFPDEWFAILAGFVGKPFLLVYRPLRRGMTCLGSVFKRRAQKNEAAKNNGGLEISSATSTDFKDVEKGQA